MTTTIIHEKFDCFEVDPETLETMADPSSALYIWS